MPPYRCVSHLRTGEAIRLSLAEYLYKLPYFKGRDRLSGAVLPSKGIRTTTICGFSMQLDLSDCIQRDIYLGRYESAESDMIRQYLRPGDTFVDVGANVGYYTALAANIVGPTGRVYAFEPDPTAFQALQQTFGGNSNIYLLQLAVGASQTRRQLFVPPKTAHNHDPSFLQYCAEMAGVDVDVTTLDRALDTLDQIALLKLDIEGYEPQALAGASELLASRRIRAILCELNTRLLDMAGSSPTSILETLRGYGFAVDRVFGTGVSNVFLSRPPS